MKGLTPSFLLPFYGLLLFWSNKTESTKPSPSSTSGPVTAVPVVSSTHKDQAMILKCNSSMDDYCFHGECMYLLDLNEHHCKCERGYSGHRCAHMSLVIRPLSEEKLILTVVCVILAVLGLAGAGYFTYRWWHKKNAGPPGQKDYQEVQMA